jgi:hypothetical protein
VATIDILDLTVLAQAPADVQAEESALNADYGRALMDVARKLGSVARVALAPGDDPTVVVNEIRAAAVANRLDVKIVEHGNAVYFYIHGPQPEDFVRQYNLRPPNAPE